MKITEKHDSFQEIEVILTTILDQHQYSKNKYGCLENILT